MASTIERIEDYQLNYVFTDGHAVMMVTDFYNYKSDLDKNDYIQESLDDLITVIKKTTSSQLPYPL